MSYKEYIDLFEKCQKTAPYHIFIYDMCNSRLNCSIERNKLILELLHNVYGQIQKIEKETKIKILHKSNELSSIYIEENMSIMKIQENKGRADLCEPFFLNGDLFGFTILRNTLNEKQVDTIFEAEKKKLNITYEFHKANGYYETDNYNEGGKKYFRGYCIQQLEEKSKEITDNEIER